MLACCLKVKVRWLRETVRLERPATSGRTRTDLRAGLLFNGPLAEAAAVAALQRPSYLDLRQIDAAAQKLT